MDEHDTTEHKPLEPLPSDTFARRLRQARTDLRLSQAALASRVTALLGSNVDPTTITRIEKNERVVRLDEAVAIAQALDLPLGLLAYEDPIASNEQAIADLREALRAALQVQHEANVEVDRIQHALRALLEQDIDLERAMGLDDPDAVLPDCGAPLDANLADNIDARVPRRD